MPDYRRLRMPGGTYFFTVNLLERRLDTLIRYVDDLREAVRATRRERPFHIDAWVVLPDHMHCVWTLPPGDDDFSNCWKEIKIHFVRLCLHYLTATGPGRSPNCFGTRSAGISVLSSPTPPKAPATTAAARSI